MTSVAYAIAMPASRAVLSPALPPSWLPPGAAIFADVPNGRFWAGRRLCPDLATWLAAAGATFSGGAGRYYTTSGGLLATAGLNAPRLNTIGAAPYFLYEAAATNELLNANTFTAWTKLGSPTPPVVTAAAAAGPDGATSASRVDFGAITGASDYTEILQSNSLASARRTSSIYIRAYGAGDVGKYVGIAQYVSTFANLVTVQLTAGWQRISSGSATSTSGTVLTVLGAWGASYGGHGAQAAFSALVAFAQQEPSLAATSYIPTTTAAVTRAAESVSGLGVAGNLTVTFDDNSTQVISTSGFSNPANLNRPNIAHMSG